MWVNLFDMDDGERFRGSAWLRTVFETDDDEYYHARYELERHGRYYVGGGAAPLTLLVRIARGYP